MASFRAISANDPEARVDASARAVREMHRARYGGHPLDAGLVSASGLLRAQSFVEWAGGTRITLALVFTDIVGSVALGNLLGNEAMIEVCRLHFQQGRSLIRKYHGYEVRTIGDSFMAAFRTALEALNFVLDFAASPGAAQIRIGAGIHVGTCQIEEGDAYGAMVNYTARIQNLAGPDEVWVSNRVREDIEEEKAKAHEGLRWIEMSGCQLKGFADTHRLWCLQQVSQRGRGGSQ